MAHRRSRLPAALAVTLVCGTASVSARATHEEIDCAGRRPACSQPPAAVVSPQRLHTAWITTKTADDFDTCSIPRATCAQPFPASVALVRSSVQTHSVTEALDLWERAAASRALVSERDRSWLSRRNEPALSAHAIETAARLLGPVRARGLSTEFDWTTSTASATQAVLEGIPREDAVRLFCPCVRVVLDRETGVVCGMEMAARDGQWVTLKLPEPMGHDAPVIKLAGFETTASDEELAALPPPPAPQRIVAEPTGRRALR
ncbi:MAG: hypothetical protein SH850_10570 [Planctomycetaceae bacterium]|nr:hypothetical protein [Planctomycetaceae bacterium]